MPSLPTRVAVRLLLLALRSARLLRPGFALWLGGVLGDAYARLPGRDQGRCRAHLRLAFPEASSAWIERTARKTFRHFGRMGLWTLATLHRPPRQLLAANPIEGRDRYEACRARCAAGQGTLIVSGHLGNWELLARTAGSVMPATVLGRRMHDPLLDALIVWLRSAGDNRMIYQDAGVLACLRELRQGRLMATLPDQDVGRLAGAFVPFFGRPAYTPTGPAMLAIMAKVPIQSVFCYERAGRWVQHWGPAWMPATTGDRNHDAAVATARIMHYQEAVMRRFPWQWAWWHKRWRHRPADKPEAVVIAG